MIQEIQISQISSFYMYGIFSLSEIPKSAHTMNFYAGIRVFVQSVKLILYCKFCCIFPAISITYLFIFVTLCIIMLLFTPTRKTCCWKNTSCTKIYPLFQIMAKVFISFKHLFMWDHHSYYMTGIHVVVVLWYFQR